MKVLVTSGLGLSEEQLSELASLKMSDGKQIEVLVSDDRERLSADALLAEVVIGTGFFRHATVNEFPNLRFVQFTSAGLDGLPLTEFENRGIRYANASGVYIQPMTEWVLLQILRFYKHSALFDEQQSAHKWEKHRDLLELSGKTAAIIGYGSVGQSIGNLLSLLGVSVLAVSRSVKEVPPHGQYVPLEKIKVALGQADIVVLSIAHTSDTHHLIDHANLTAIKPGGVLLNLARGGVINTEALVTTIDHGHFRGVALDVFEEEPLPSSSPLWTLPSVVVTPHVSFVSDRTQERMFRLALSNVEKALD